MSVEAAEAFDRDEVARRVTMILLALRMLVRNAHALGIMERGPALSKVVDELKRAALALALKHRIATLPRAELDVQWLHESMTPTEIAGEIQRFMVSLGAPRS